jgi:hypothetical protein
MISTGWRRPVVFEPASSLSSTENIDLDKGLAKFTKYIL